MLVEENTIFDDLTLMIYNSVNCDCKCGWLKYEFAQIKIEDTATAKLNVLNGQSWVLKLQL